MKLLLVVILIIVVITATATGNGVPAPNDPQWEDCEINDDDAAQHPWLTTLHIEMSRDDGEEDHTHSLGPGTQGRTNVYDWWPVVIIGPSLLLTSGRTFRSPHSDRKMRILENEQYSIKVTDENGGEQILSISYIKPFPNISERYEFWMKTENDVVLIHLNEPITFSRRVRRLCLPESDADIEIPVNESTMLSGWECSYHYAVTKLTSMFYLRTQSYERCNCTWHDQGRFSLDDVVEYENRTCGVPCSQSAEDGGKEPGFCAVKGYFNIRNQPIQGEVEGAGGRKRRVLVGLLSGVAEEFLTGSGDGVGATVYIWKLTNETCEWIKHNTDCGSDMYACNDGLCIPYNLTCNGVPYECADNSDEEPCYCRARNYCERFEFECGYMGECKPIPSLDSGDKIPAECDGVCDCVQDNCVDEEQPFKVKECKRVPSHGGFGGWMEDNWTYVVFSGIGTFFFVLAVGGSIVRKLTWKNSDLYLSPDEVAEFRQGVEWEGVLEPAQQTGGNEGVEVQQRAMQMPYIYDIDEAHVEFGEQLPGGSTSSVWIGSFGGASVILKKLNREACENRPRVIKQTFKLFLAELKILAYVTFVKGGHRNIVKLIGAVTQNISNLDITIVTEYCLWGSILDYLHSHQAAFQNCGAQLPWPPLTPNREYMSEEEAATQGGASPRLPPTHYIAAAAAREDHQSGRNQATSRPSYTHPVSHIAFLYKWAQEVLEGLCFLASHRIIHGDLALRNVLLSLNMIAKIGDFGLSHQLHYYNILSTTRIESGTGLPWQWTGPEVLANMSISIKSDVWSFGVLMWELFTLGQLPYGLGLEFSPNFIEQLRHGLKLPKPQHANHETFAIIQSCWHFCPHNRPDFESLRQDMNRLLEQRRPQHETQLE